MRILSILVILAVALQAGNAFAGVKKIAQSRDQNRAKVMQHYNKMKQATEQSAKKLKSAKYLEEVTPRIPPRKGPNVVLKGKNTKPRIQSGALPAEGHLEKAWENRKVLNKTEKALLKNLGWSHQTWNTKEPLTKSASRTKPRTGNLMPFTKLNPVQRESIRKLRFMPHDWDNKIQALNQALKKQRNN